MFLNISHEIESVMPAISENWDVNVWLAEIGLWKVFIIIYNMVKRLLFYLKNKTDWLIFRFDEE